MTGGVVESSVAIRERVVRSRSFAEDRPDEIEDAAQAQIASALEAALVTARGAARIRRVARTIADLAMSVSVGEEHVAEAMALRNEW